MSTTKLLIQKRTKFLEKTQNGPKHIKWFLVFNFCFSEFQLQRLPEISYPY